jgi:hypothetical protein
MVSNLTTHKKTSMTSTIHHPSLTSYTITTTMSVTLITMVSKLVTQNKFRMSRLGLIGCAIKKKPK